MADLPPISFQATTPPGPVAEKGRFTVGADAAGRPLQLIWSTRGDVTEVEMDASPTEELDRSAPVLAEALSDLRQSIEARGRQIRLAANHPAEALDPLPEAVADSVGFTNRRDLLQMRRPLPVEADHPLRASAPAVRTRAYRPGADDGAWIRVNNRAFEHHADQGNETLETVEQRTSEPWFSRTGFRVADDPERRGELLGFCWTKIHQSTNSDPLLGEIYVIGVDPSHHGKGLGVALALDGLDHMAERAVDSAVLYVDADNAAALRLYDGLGFTVYQRRRVYTP